MKSSRDSGLELVGAAEPGEGALHLAEVGVDLAGAARELGAPRVVGRQSGELRGVDRGEAALGAADLGEALELGPDGLVGELFVEEHRHRLEGGTVVLELLFVERGEALEEVAALARLLAGDEARVEGDLDAGPVGAAQVDRLQHLAGAGLVLRVFRGGEERLELGHGALVGGIARERFAELVEGALRIVRVVPSDLGDVDAQVGGDAELAVELPLVERDQVPPALGGAVERLERGDGPGLQRHVEDGLVGDDGAVAIGERALRELGLAEEQALLLVVALGVLDAQLEDLEQVGRVVGLAVELLEGHERAAVAAARLERLLVLGDGEGAVLELAARELTHAEAEALLHVAVEDLVDDRLVRVEDLSPAEGGLAEALHRLDPRGDLALARGELEPAEGVAEGARRVGERALGGAERGLQRLQALARVLGRLDLDLEHAEEPLGVPVGLVERAQRLGGVAPCFGHVEQRLERGAAALARRIEAERLPVRVERAGEVLLVQAAHVAEAREEAEAILGLVGEREVDLQRLFEVAPARVLFVEGLERRERGALRPELVEHRAPPGDGLGDVPDLVGERLGGLDQGAAPLGLGGLGLLARVEHGDEIAPRRGALVEALQRGERRHVRRIVGEARAPGDDGLVRVLEHRLVEAADALVELAALLHVGLELDLDAEVLGEGVVAALAGVDAAEGLRRRDHQRGIVAIDLDDALVDLLGAGLVLEQIFEDPRDFHEDLAAGRGRGRGVGGGGEHRRHLLVVGEAAADLHEALAHRAVLGLERHELGEGGEGAVIVAEALVAEHAHAAEQLAPIALVRRALAADLEDAHQLADLVARLVDALEHAGGAVAEVADLQQALDELAGLAVVLADAEHVFEVAERLRGLVQPIEVDAPEGELDVDRLLLRGGVEPVLEQRREILPALLALVELLQRVERRRVERVEDEDALVVADGLGRIADDLLGDEGDLVEQLDPILLVGRALGGAIVELFQLGPALTRGEDLLEAVEGARVGGLDGEHALEVRHGALGVAELLVVQARRPLAELDLHGLGGLSPAPRPATRWMR